MHFNDNLQYTANQYPITNIFSSNHVDENTVENLAQGSGSAADEAVEKFWRFQNRQIFDNRDK